MKSGENFLKAEEICKIIVTCRKAGVAEFGLGSMRVLFNEPVREARPVPAPEVAQGVAPTPATQLPEETIQAQTKIEQESIEEQGIRLREERIAELIIEDPLLAEKLMEDGELVPGESTDGDGSNESEALDIGSGPALPVG